MSQRQTLTLVKPDINALDDFTRGYVIAMLWTEEDEIKGKTFADISKVSLSKIVADCAEFQKKYKGALRFASRRPGYSRERAGHDFWLSRNGHGAGFFDRDELEVPLDGSDLTLGNLLQEKARKANNRYIYLGDDGKIYYH